MNAEELTAALAARLRGRVAASMDQLGASMATTLKNIVAVPVERTKGRVIRSKPGEAPRRDTGAYQESITHATTESGNTIRTESGSPRKLADWLQHGTNRMAPRNHYDRLREQIAPEVVDRIRQNL